MRDSNYIHTYVMGESDLLYGTEFAVGSIVHVLYMSDTMKKNSPWVEGMWFLSDADKLAEYFSTLKEAKARAIELWPTCSFKTRKEYAKEYTR